MIHPSRIHELNSMPEKNGPVLYWMSRDQRSADNWALLYAALRAAEKGVPLYTAFCLAPGFPGATAPHYNFMLQGLMEVESGLKKIGLPFKMLRGDPCEAVPEFARLIGAGIVVTDFDPLKIKRSWGEFVASVLTARCVEVDSHNIVPCRAASFKAEYGAFTFRKKINKVLHEYLHPFPEIENVKQDASFPVNEWDKIRTGIMPDVTCTMPGEAAARLALDDFIMNRLERYHKDRNDPNKNMVSRLSPYLHFGQLSAQRVALEVLSADVPRESRDDFLEQLIVRRELSDNFCLYNNRYDSFEGFPRWAQETLNIHRHDTREYLYDREQFENSLTHDDIWNAAQNELVMTGTMHGYMRMYWAKKILEWTDSPEKALEIGGYLNDRYGLDGRDPNGYTGLAWSIGGVHDRPWPERKVFGKIRFMNDKGCRRKFDTLAYIARYKR